MDAKSETTNEDIYNEFEEEDDEEQEDDMDGSNVTSNGKKIVDINGNDSDISDDEDMDTS